MRDREQVIGEMLHHVLSRCRRCHRRRPCPEYAELEAEYDAFRRGEHEMSQQAMRDWRVGPGDCDFCTKHSPVTLTTLWRPQRITICRDCVKLAQKILPDPDTLTGEYKPLYEPEPEGGEE